MINFNIVIVLLHIIQSGYIILFSIMSIEPSKQIFRKTLEESLKEFHSNHIVGDRELERLNLTNFELIDEALYLITDERDDFDYISDGDRMYANMILKLHRNYKHYQKRIIKRILQISFIIAAIKIGLGDI